MLDHGADPNIRSSYNKNAWDLAKDELDAAMKVTKSNADIRQVLIDYTTSSQGKGLRKIFGNGEVVRVSEANLYEGLEGTDGTAMVMKIEMNKEVSKADKSLTANKKGGKKTAPAKGGAAATKPAAVAGAAPKKKK